MAVIGAPLLLWALALGPPAAVPAPGAAETAFAQLNAVHRIGEVVLSADGRQVAWIEGIPGGTGPATTSLRVASLAGALPLPRTISLGKGKVRIRHLAFSPDGRRLALLSDADSPGRLQLYLVDVSRGATRRLTSLKGELGALRFSPDGGRVAFLFTENAQAAAGPTAAKPTETGVIGEHMDVQRLAVLDTASGRVRTVSTEGLYVHEFDWAPDGRSWAAAAAPPPGDDGWYTSKLYAIDTDTGEARVVSAPATQIGAPRWSPDGKSIAFVAGLMSDEGVVGGEILIVPASGGEARNLTPGRSASVSWLAWHLSSHDILFAEYADGGSGVASVEVASGHIKRLWHGAERLSAANGLWGPTLAVASDGRTTAAVRQSFDRPPEVWAGPIGAWNQVSRANPQPVRPWGEATSLTWKSDGLDVQGWLVAPRDIVAGKRYPLIVDVHGGPAGAWLPSWPATSTLALTSDGFFVFLPNPRGSHGRGQAFVRGNVKDLGGGDLRDILAGVEEVTRTAPVDPERIGVTGVSYGGFMTMWAVTQTRRFRAAVSVAGISNWQSYWGQNGIPAWMLPYFGASVYEDPAVYAKSSPINFIKNVATPTLMLVGEGDIECPPPQSYEFWRGLRAMGVKTELVVYAGEGHGFARPENRQDAMRRTRDWFHAHLGAGAP